MDDESKWKRRAAEASDGWAGHRWTLTAAVAVILVVVAGLVWVVALHGSGNNVNSAAGKAISSDPTTAPASQPSSSVTTAQGPPRCTLASKVSTTIPTATAPVTNWVNVEGFYFPTSTSDGPLFRNGAAWTCFSHTPTGALLTATSVSVSTELGDQHAFASYFPPGHWSQAQLDNLVPPGGSAPDPGVQIVGYQFGPFTQDGGTFSLVESCTAAECQAPYYSIAIQVEWENNQWYLTGDTFQTGTGTTLQSLVGVTPWGYVS
jgi:hypothetical protein